MLLVKELKHMKPPVWSIEEGSLMMKRVLKMAVLHGLLASLGVVPGLWGLVILQPSFDPAQVAGKFGEHQTAAITVCG